MKIIMLFLSLMSTGFLVRAQNGLLVRNSHSGKQVFFKERSKISFLLANENDFSTERFILLGDSSLLAGPDTVKLDAIIAIRKRSAFHQILRIAGMPVMLAGVLLMGDGTAAMISKTENNNGLQLVLLGAGLFSLGYLPYFFEMDDFEVGLKSEWTVEVCRSCRLQK